MVKINKLEILGYIMFFIGLFLFIFFLYLDSNFYSLAYKIPSGVHVVELNNHGTIVYITKKQNLILKLCFSISIICLFATAFFWLKSGNHKVSLKGDRPLISRKTDDEM